MFTGIIEEVGSLDAVEPRAAGSRLRIRARKICQDLREGDSIAVSGVCLTAVNPSAGGFWADASPETLSRSSLSGLKIPASVNLERALLPTTRLGGHIVQGHVDATGELVSLELLGDDNWWLRLRIPVEIERYVVFKGSIAVEGISLTVAGVQGDLVSITIVPHTYANTNLRHKRPGDRLNLEVDVMAKYAEKLLAHLAPPARKLTLEHLQEEGY